MPTTIIIISKAPQFDQSNPLILHGFNDSKDMCNSSILESSEPTML